VNFDYTYLILFGKIIFEPVTILTNLLIAFFCFYAFSGCSRIKTKLATQWAWFFMLIGISSLLGSVAHGVHFQLGNSFLQIVIFLMNSVSLVAIYFCFKAANITLAKGKGQNRFVDIFVITWIILLLVITFMQNNFVLIKIHAGIVLTYSLIIHFLANKKPGNAFIAWGIIISFLSIVVHSLHLSFSEWFNYKDIAHVIMVISLATIYRGVMLRLRTV
jgi:hypothetical protein